VRLSGSVESLENIHEETAPCGHGSVENRWQRMAPPHRDVRAAPGWPDWQSVRRLATCPTIGPQVFIAVGAATRGWAL